MLTYYETSDGSFSPRIQELCEKLVLDLHDAGVTGIHLRRKLGLTPRAPFMRFRHSKGDSPLEKIERSFVDVMRKLGIDERREVYFGGKSHDWSDFPETHDYLARSFSRLEKALHAGRIEAARKRDFEIQSRLTPVSRGAVILADILGPSAREPNQSPQRNAGSRPSSDVSPASETPSSLGPRS